MSRVSFGAGQAWRNLIGQVRSRALKTILRLGLTRQSEVHFRASLENFDALIEVLVRSGQDVPHYWQALTRFGGVRWN